MSLYIYPNLALSSSVKTSSIRINKPFKTRDAFSFVKNPVVGCAERFPNIDAALIRS